MIKNNLNQGSSLNQVFILLLGLKIQKLSLGFKNYFLKLEF